MTALHTGWQGSELHEDGDGHHGTPDCCSQGNDAWTRAASLLQPARSPILSRVKWQTRTWRKWKWVAALQPSAQLWGEAYVALIYWTALVEFVRNVYWFQLEKAGIATEAGFMVYLFTSALVLAHPFLRSYLQGHAWSRALLLLCGLVGIWGQFLSSALTRLAFSATATGILGIYVNDGLWAATAARRRRAAFGVVGGVLLLQVLRWAHAGPNPLVARWWGFLLVGLIPGVVIALLLLTEDLAPLDDWHPEQTPSGSEDDCDDGSGMTPLSVRMRQGCSAYETRGYVGIQNGLHGLEGNGSALKEVTVPIKQDQLEKQPNLMEMNTDRGGLRDLINGAGGFGGHQQPVGTPPQGGDASLELGSGRQWGEGEEVPWVQPGADGSESDLEVYRQRGWRYNTRVCMRTLQMSVGSGCLWFLTHWLATAPTTVARWLGVSVIWAAPLAMVALGLGMVVAAEAARCLWLKRMHGVLVWLIAMVGALLMMWRMPWAVLGATLLVLMLPSMWVMMARNMVGVYPGVGLGLSALVYVLLVVWSTALVAYEFMPGGNLVRGTRGVLLGCAVGGIGLGVCRGPELHSIERWASGARLGIARLTWGSGIPGRRTLGVLMAVVGIFLAVGMIMRLQPGPAWNNSTSASLRVLNFNIQQGFSRAGSVNYDTILAMLDAEQPHVIMLQETDTMHIVHGNLDLIDCWATRLKLYSWYSPATKGDTWGCAMLSTEFLAHGNAGVLPSPHGENACFQQAVLQWGRAKVHLVNTHFGVTSSDILLQAMDMVHKIDVDMPLVLAGDFNMAPLTAAYNTTVASGLVDGYVKLHGPWKGPRDRDPGAGYVFSSPALNCTSWEEPQYDQQLTADGDPTVATFVLI